jgi:hypothetical protein
MTTMMPNNRMHTNRRPAFQFRCAGFLDAGFAASAPLQRLSLTVSFGKIERSMRLLGISLCLIGCGWLSYQTLIFEHRLDSAVEHQVFLIQRYVVSLTPEQAVTRFRDLGREVDSFRPAIWPGVVLVLVGSGLLSWYSLAKRRVRDMNSKAEQSAPPNGGPAASVDNPNAPGGPTSVS